jgi:hypothetical protein
MTDFSHLKVLEVKNKTAEYTIYQIAGEPVLIVKPATEANKGYFNSVLRRSRRNLHAVKAGSISQKMIKENRAEDRELYPKHIVNGWKTMKDSKGKDVPFSPEAAHDFLEALPDWLFDEIRAFCGASQNFSGEPIDIEAKLGN